MCLLLLNLLLGASALASYAPRPVLLVSGLGGVASDWDNVRAFLEARGIATAAFDYSDNYGSIELLAHEFGDTSYPSPTWMERAKEDFVNRGVPIGKLNVVAFSAGGA